MDEAKDEDGDDDDDDDAGKWWFRMVRESLLAFNITGTNKAIALINSNFFAHFKMVTMMRRRRTVMSPHQRNKDKARRLVFLIYTKTREIFLRGPPMVVMAQWFPPAISVVAAITVGPRKPSFLAHHTLFSLLVDPFSVETPTVWQTCTIECVCQVDIPLVAFD